MLVGCLIPFVKSTARLTHNVSSYMYDNVLCHVHEWLDHSVSLQHPLCTGMFRPPKLRVQLSLDRLEQCDVQCQYYRREVQESEQVRHDLLKQEVCSMFFGALYTVCTLYSLYCFPTYTPVFQVQFMHFVCIYTMYLQALYNVYMYKHVLRIYPHTHCRL